MKHEYDYLLVGAGLFNAVFAQQAKMHGKRCLVIDKRPHLGGNIYCENIDGITVPIGYAAEKGRIQVVQKYRALKANSKVANALIENGECYETSLEDSSILFGNTEAKMRVTILSNPHCNPCARMHKHVENLLRLSGGEICIQYIFSSFSEKLEDSCRYLIYCYFEYERNESLHRFALWYSKDKFDYERIINNNDSRIHTKIIEEEMDRHRKWRTRASLIETPTILVNGYKLPDEYDIEDLAMIVNNTINEDISCKISMVSTSH